MNKKFSKLSGIVTLCLLAVLAGVGTYAYYATTKNGTLNATSLSWSFKAGASADKVDTKDFTITIPDAQPGSNGFQLLYLLLDQVLMLNIQLILQ